MGGGVPELPEVETLARHLKQLLVGAQFATVQVRWARSVAMPSAEELARELPGHSIEDVGRRGKFLHIALSGGHALLVHLRMSGQLRVQAGDAAVDDHARVVFRLTDGRALIFSDTRKFGRVYWTANPICITSKLGAEPLDPDWTQEEFRTLLVKHKGALKPLLLNQTIVAGLGNIYTDEALFRASLHPLRKANSLRPDEFERLYCAIREVLAEAIARRGTTLPDARYRDAEGHPGTNQDNLYVYQRTGQPCLRCGNFIERIVVGQRGTHFCPHCQITPSGVQEGDRTVDEEINHEVRLSTAA